MEIDSDKEEEETSEDSGSNVSWIIGVDIEVHDNGDIKWRGRRIPILFSALSQGQ